VDLSPANLPSATPRHIPLLKPLTRRNPLPRGPRERRRARRSHCFPTAVGGGVKDFVFEEDFVLPVTLYQHPGGAAGGAEHQGRPFQSKALSLFVLATRGGGKDTQVGSLQLDLSRFATPECLEHKVTVPVTATPESCAAGTPHLTLSIVMAIRHKSGRGSVGSSALSSAISSDDASVLSRFSYSGAQQRFSHVGGLDTPARTMDNPAPMAPALPQPSRSISLAPPTPGRPSSGTPTTPSLPPFGDGAGGCAGPGPQYTSRNAGAPAPRGRWDAPVDSGQPGVCGADLGSTPDGELLGTRGGRELASGQDLERHGKGLEAVMHARQERGFAESSAGHRAPSGGPPETTQRPFPKPEVQHLATAHALREPPSREDRYDSDGILLDSDEDDRAGPPQAVLAGGATALPPRRGGLELYTSDAPKAGRPGGGHAKTDSRVRFADVLREAEGNDVPVSEVAPKPSSAASGADPGPPKKPTVPPLPAKEGGQSRVEAMRSARAARLATWKAQAGARRGSQASDVQSIRSLVPGARAGKAAPAQTPTVVEGPGGPVAGAAYTLSSGSGAGDAVPAVVERLGRHVAGAAHAAPAGIEARTSAPVDPLDEHTAEVIFPLRGHDPAQGGQETDNEHDNPFASDTGESEGGAGVAGQDGARGDEEPQTPGDGAHQPSSTPRGGGDPPPAEALASGSPADSRSPAPGTAHAAAPVPAGEDPGAENPFLSLPTTSVPQANGAEPDLRPPLAAGRPGQEHSYVPDDRKGGKLSAPADSRGRGSVEAGGAENVPSGDDSALQPAARSQRVAKWPATALECSVAPLGQPPHPTPGPASAFAARCLTRTALALAVSGDGGAVEYLRLVAEKARGGLLSATSLLTGALDTWFLAVHTRLALQGRIQRGRGVPPLEDAVGSKAAGAIVEELVALEHEAFVAGVRHVWEDAVAEFASRTRGSGAKGVSSLCAGVRVAAAKLLREVTPFGTPGMTFSALLVPAVVAVADAALINAALGAAPPAGVTRGHRSLKGVPAWLGQRGREALVGGPGAGGEEAPLTFGWAMGAKMEMTGLIEALGMPTGAHGALVPLTRCLADLLMLPKDLAGEPAVLGEVCHALSTVQTARALELYQPDTFCSDPLDPGVLAAALDRAAASAAEHLGLATVDPEDGEALAAAAWARVRLTLASATASGWYHPVESPEELLGRLEQAASDAGGRGLAPGQVRWPDAYGVTTLEGQWSPDWMDLGRTLGGDERTLAKVAPRVLPFAGAAGARELSGLWRAQIMG